VFEISGLRVSPDGRLVLGFMDQSLVFLWDVDQRKLVTPKKSSQPPATFSASSDLIAIADDWHSLSVRSTANLSSISKIKGLSIFRGVSISPDSRLLIIAEDNDSFVPRARFRCIDIATGTNRWNFNRDDGSARAITWKSDGSCALMALQAVDPILFTRNDGLLEAVDPVSGRELKRVPVHSYITCFSQGPDSESIVAGNADGEVVLFNATTLLAETVVNPDLGSITSISRFQGGYLVSGRKAAVVVDERLQKIFPGASRQLADFGYCSISANGKVLAAIEGEKRVIVLTCAKADK
jgi:WD40 repeat protein